MKRLKICGIAAIVALLLITVSVAASLDMRDVNSPLSTMSRSISKENVLEKFTTVRESPIFSQYSSELSRYLNSGGTSQTGVVITDSSLPYGYCSTCTGVSQYTVINHYSSGPTFYPDPVQPSERDYGSMVVTGPDDGRTYYLWVKPLFFALDVEDYYDMKWHGCGILPVYFDKNILSGSYCLKVTTGSSTTSDGVWCGNAVVAPNQTTTVNVYPSGCPFGCNCC